MGFWPPRPLSRLACRITTTLDIAASDIAEAVQNRPFIVWCRDEPARAGCGINPLKLGGSSTVENGTRFYLWPDALRIYFFGAAVFLAVGFALAGHPRTAVFSFVWTAVLAPYVLFYLFRAPVLDCMHVLDRHPDGVGASGLAELRVAQVVPGFPGWRGFVPRPLIAVDTRLNDPEQSAYAALVASAVADFFSSRSESDGLCRRGYRRWFLYWASPVWTGYACLLAAYFDNATADGNLLDLSVVWTALSALYLFQQTCAFQRRAAHLDSLTLLRQRSMLVKLRLDFRDCPLHVRAPQLDRLLVQGANLIPAAVLTILPLMAQIWTMND